MGREGKDEGFEERRFKEFEEKLLRVPRDWLADMGGSPAELEPEDVARRTAPFTAGEVFGGFRLRERLGAGASGEVWSADELALGRPVALKFLKPEVAADSQANERFRREALAEARIRHPGVVAVYSIGRIEGQAYIAQELVEGGRTVGSWILEARASGALGPTHFRQAAACMAQAADALAAAHAQGIYHRDIKPHNLLLTSDGRIKVADFGLAHLAGELSISRLGDVFGTVPYMSPSQVRGQVDQLDARGDVFSLGATLYELVTLERAFPGRSLAEIAHKVLSVDPVAPRRLQARISSDLELIIQRSLEKEAVDRYASMSEFAADLRRFLAGEPPLARSRSMRGRLRMVARRHPTLAVSSCIALLASSVLIWQAWNGLERDNLRIAAQVENLEARAQLALEFGGVDEAERLVSQMDALTRDNPTGHLILAAGYMRLGRVPESEREILLARQRGFRADPAQLVSGIEHGAYAMYLQYQRDFTLYPEAERHIELALQLDPSLYALQFTRYLMRIAVRDDPGAAEALLAFQAHLPIGDPVFHVVDALHLEIDSDPEKALKVLDDLAKDQSEEQLKALRWHRNAGRLCVRVGDLERAEPLLLRAVEDAPLDCWSWDSLGVVYQIRLQRGDERPDVREMARKYATQARTCSSSLLNPNYVLAYVAEWDLDHGLASSNLPEHPAWQEAREAIDRLHALGSGDTETTRNLEARLLLFEALPLYRDKRHAEAATLLARSVELDLGSLQAVGLFCECSYWSEQYARGVEMSRFALEREDDPSWKGVRDAHWLGMVLAWGLANAAKVSDRASFEVLKQRLERELESGVSFPREELLNAAEFLATAPGELRACDLAWKLIDDNRLEEAFAGSPGEDDVREVLERIAAACP